MRSVVGSISRKRWRPDAPFPLLPDLVEVVEVKQEEEKSDARERLIASGFDLTPRRSTDAGGVLCLPMEKNLKGDIKAKHPDWELIQCPHCGLFFCCHLWAALPLYKKALE